MPTHEGFLTASRHGPALAPSAFKRGEDVDGNAIAALGPKVDCLITIAVNATSGTWTATFDGVATDPIEFDATAAEVQAAFEDVVGANKLFVAGGPGNSGATTPYYVNGTGEWGGSALLSGHLDSVASVSLAGGGATITRAVVRAGGFGAQADQYILGVSPFRAQGSSLPLLPPTIAGVTAGVNEVQNVTQDGTGGTFTVTFDGLTTGAIAFDELEADIQTIFDAAFGEGNFLIAGDADDFDVTFLGDYANADQALATAAESLTPNNTYEVQTFQVDATGGTFTLTFEGQTTGAIAANATGGTVQTALEALSNVAADEIVIVRSGAPNNYLYTATFALTLVGDRDEMTSNPASLTGGMGTVTHATTTPGVDAAAVIISEDTAGETSVLTYTEPTGGATVRVSVCLADTEGDAGELVAQFTDAASPLTITGLQDATDYRVYVQAVTSDSRLGPAAYADVTTG